MDDILDYLSHLSWVVTDPPRLAKEYRKNGNEDQLISPTRLHETLFNEIVILSLHTSRYNDSQRQIYVSGTVYDVLHAIYSFYSGLLLTESDIKDLWHLKDGYYQEASNNFRCGHTITYGDIIGEAKYFEGFEVNEDGANYRLRCGT